MLHKNLLMRSFGGLAFLLSSTFVSAQTLTIKGSDAANPFYVQHGAVLFIQGGVSVISDGGNGNDYLQNNGTIKLVSGATPNTSNFDNNVVGLKTYTVGQTTGELIFAADNEAQTITGPGSVEFMNLTVNNALSPTVLLQQDASVAGILQLGGLINLQNNNLTLLSSGSLAGAPYSTSNMVQADGNGQFRYDLNVISSNSAFTFPVGDAANYVPVSIDFSSNSNAGFVGVNVVNATHPNNNVPGAPYVYLNRYWKFSSSLSNYSYTGSFSYPITSLSNISREPSMKLSRWNGSAWNEFAGSSAASGELTITPALDQTTAPLSGDFTGRTLCGNPAAFNVTGGACVPATMGLSGSEVGVNYQLVRDGNINVGSPVAGTGAALNMGVQNVAGVYSVVATNATTGCTENMIGVSTVAICTSTWLGATDTSWFTQTNWDPAAVPNNCASNVIIPASTPFSPVISASTVTIGNMSIASGAVLKLNGQTLNVCGNWTGGSGNNAAVVGTGTVLMNSTNGAQTIANCTQFNILQINNSNGVSLTSASTVSINSGLHLQGGILDVSNGTLRLLSTSSSHAAYIDDFTSGFTGSINGSILADRFVPVAGRNQHFISSPVSLPALSQIGASGPDGSFVTPTANCSETQSAQGSAYGTVFVYDDNHMSQGACKLGNWMIKSQGTMQKAKGYSVYLTGNAIKTLSGSPNTGNISIGGLNNKGGAPVPTLQSPLTPIESGWNLVGNPYPSTIHLTMPRIDSGFANQVQVWVTSGPFSGGWISKVIGVDNDIYIAPFQAFMVLKTSAGNNGNYPFYQNERIRQSNTSFYRSDIENNLTLELNYNNTKDITTVQFHSQASNEFDEDLDANKSSSMAGKPMIFTHLNERGYSINTLPSITQATAVPMGLRPEVNATMTLSPQGLNSFDPSCYIFLEDKQTQVWHNLRNGSYTFNTKATDNQDRFVLHFTPPAQILVTDATCSASGQIEINQPGSANWNYQLRDNNNSIIATGIINASSPTSINVIKGIYTLTLTDNNGYSVMKHIEVMGSQSIIASFTASSHNAKTHEEINFNTTTTDITHAEWNFGDGATAQSINTTHAYQSEGIYNVSLTVTNQESCKSTSSQTVVITSREATGISTLTKNKINIWSSGNEVYIDFSKQSKVEAEIEIYNIIGQIISKEKFGRSTIYNKEIPNLEVAYILVRVMNNGSTTTERVFIGK